MTTLIIVESPGKVKTISAYLGAGYKVAASVGHVRDLPSGSGAGIGLAPPDFRLNYEPTARGRKILHDLRSDVASADRVLLATDPDREGEAIAWHLADALRLKNPERITFTAITSEQVKKAVNSPRPLDMNRVHAQEARRALDRLFGFRVSPALSDRAGERLSAGRVQSPAVRLVVDRERAISAFKVTDHFGAELTFTENNGSSWRALWDVKPHLKGDEKYLLDGELTKKVAAIREVSVESFSDEEKARGPEAPFTTSSLQQIASKRLKMKPKRTMEVAQALYEAGLITYHRTDAPNLDAAGIEDIAAYATTADLPLHDKQRVFKAKEGAQEGHEAIRPTHADKLEAGENDDERALYRLIWQRAVASQLADAKYAVRSVELSSSVDDTPVRFTATGRTLVSPGFLKIYADDATDADEKSDEEAEASNPIPVLALKSLLTATSGRVLAKKTKPPVRFKQASLVAELERCAIGRPSTYAAILDTILSRAYVTEDNKGYLLPSRIGETVRDALVGRFAFAEFDYTRNLEDRLDDIAGAKSTYQAVVSDAWTALDAELIELGSLNIAPTHPCPACGKAMRAMNSPKGAFWGCSGYPDCKTTLPDAKGKPGERKAAAPVSDFSCPDCAKPLARRKGMSKPKQKGQKPKPYDFYSCTGYPACNSKFQTGSDGTPVIEPKQD